MGAEHVINPNQLTLFERAGDLADPAKTGHIDFEEYPDEGDSMTFDEFRSNKLWESKYGDDSLYEDIKKHGVKQPVTLVHSDDLYGSKRPKGDPDKVLMEGHHRVFSQADINPDTYIPVEWD
jgi:hypothetical protein